MTDDLLREATTTEWGLEYGGEFYPLDRRSEMTRENAERALIEVQEYLNDDEVAHVATRQVHYWKRISSPTTTDGAS